MPICNLGPDPDDSSTLTRDKYLFFGGSLFICAILFVILFAFCSCTISFQNISTHGVADDLVDETQTPSNQINPNISVPISGI